MMYKEFFGFAETPFSIVPNSRYLYLSQRHREAIQHLQAGLGYGGGFALLTGEVGTGKTTIARAMLAALNDETQAGFILNPTFSGVELLEAICDEFAIQYPKPASLKQLNQAIYQFLLQNHAQGVQTLLVVDEAQHLDTDVLEQLRLLTNLETESRKLLRVLLVGQPELQQKLQQPQLRQLAQRITGRYHLLPLNAEETAQYIQFRLELAGGDPELFTPKSLKWIALQTLGIPRLINLVCDASLKLAYRQRKKELPFELVRSACQEIMRFQSSVYHTADTVETYRKPPSILTFFLSGVILAAVIGWFSIGLINSEIAKLVPLPEVPTPLTQQILAPELEYEIKTANHLDNAIGNLYKIWGYNASVMESFCNNEREGSFVCQREQGSLEDIQKLNLPVVLTLNMKQDVNYAVLYHISDDQVQLLLTNKRIEFSKEQLMRLWAGEYRYIWQQELPRALKEGMKGNDVQILEQKLSQVLGEQVSGSDKFDQVLKRKVESFQSWQGIEVDGIAGIETLKRLELLTQPNAPTLNASKGEA